MTMGTLPRDGVEHFGIIRARILAARAKSGIASIMISSPEAHDGKSFTALNLAISLAQLRKENILLVDADLRLRGISQGLGFETKVGLSEYLENRCSFHETLAATSMPHLTVCPAGQVTESSLPGILQGNCWPTFLQTAKSQFGLTLVDSVPVTAPVADFELVSAACDAIVLIVRLRRTSRDALDKSAQSLNGKLFGVIVNDADATGNPDYYTDYEKRKRRQRSAPISQNFRRSLFEDKPDNAPRP